MSRPRFYAPPNVIDTSGILLSKDETHHLTRVLRLKPGETVFVFDGRGKEYKCVFAAEERSGARLRIIEPLADAVESPLQLTLAQALVKGDKFDFIVQKAAELGVSRIVPLATEHAEVKPSSEQANDRLARWKRISLEALKQCGRRRLVEITAPMTAGEFLEAEGTADRGLFLIFNERGGAPLAEELKDANATRPLSVLIGPEGGWSGVELISLGERGVKPVTLGPRILRTETAAIVAVSLVQHLLGDLSNEPGSAD